MSINIYDAILKGVVEHGDGGFYLGSTLCLLEHLSVLRNEGHVDDEGRVTLAGLAFYDQSGLGELPCSGRWYLWKEAR